MWLYKNKYGRMILILPFFFLFSCGYGFVESLSLPENITRIHIRIPENPTLEAGLGSLLANDLAGEFIRKKNLSVTGQDMAEAVLFGRIDQMKVETISEKGSHSPTERRVGLTVTYRLVKADATTLWTGSLTETESFMVSTQKRITEKNRRNALSTLSERMAERVFGLVTGF